MEKSKFEEEEKQAEIIKACVKVFGEFDETVEIIGYNGKAYAIIDLLGIDKQNRKQLFGLGSPTKIVRRKEV